MRPIPKKHLLKWIPQEHCKQYYFAVKYDEEEVTRGFGDQNLHVGYQNNEASKNRSFQWERPLFHDHNNDGSMN